MYYSAFKTKKRIDVLNNVKRDLLCKTTKVAETAIKIGAEFANSCDPFAAAVAVGGKTGAGASLSRFSASQCAGLVGVIVASFTPQVYNFQVKTLMCMQIFQASVSLLLKKINDDLEYLKESLDIVREKPQFMANELLSSAIQKLDSGQFNEV